MVDIEFYKKNGWVLAKSVLSTDNLQFLENIYQKCSDNFSPSSSMLFLSEEIKQQTPFEDKQFSRIMEQWLNLWKKEPPFSTKDLLSKIEIWAEKILSAKPVIFQDVLMGKHPKHEQFQWHQDFSYWPIDRPNGVIIWIPLQETNSYNGGLCLANQSHSFGESAPINLITGNSQSGEASYNQNDFATTTPTLEAGDAILFHPLTWHSSGQNFSKTIRKSWATSWLHPECMWAPDKLPLHPISSKLKANKNVG